MEWDELYEVSPVYDQEVIGFYELLHCCTSSGTN